MNTQVGANRYESAPITGSSSDAAILDPAYTARQLEDSRRALAFALWISKPPSRRPAQQARDVAEARVPANAADQWRAPIGDPEPVPTQGASAAQPSGLDAATGNPLLERQGSRMRATAAARQPPHPLVRAAADRFAQGLHDTAVRAGKAVTDIPNEIYQAGTDALEDINAGLNPFSAERRADIENAIAANRTGTLRDSIAAYWQSQKRLGQGLLGVPELIAAPVTGLGRSVLGHTLETLPGFTYDEAKQAVDQSMIGLGPGRGGMLRAPRAPIEPRLPPRARPIVQDGGIPRFDVDGDPPASDSARGPALDVLHPPALPFVQAPSLVPELPRLTGQIHHAISKPIHRELEKHDRLAGVFQHRDQRFVTQAIDKDAHKGYQRWHRSLDREIADRIRDSPEMTPDEFEDFLRTRYNKPDLIWRFPNGL
jgi:hypothetical protein